MDADLSLFAESAFVVLTYCYYYIMVYSHRIIMISPSNYSSIILLGYDSQRPTSAARSEAHPMIYCQSPNKPGCVRGLLASAAPSRFDRTAHLVYMLRNVKGSPAGLLVRKAPYTSSIIHKLLI